MATSCPPQGTVPMNIEKSIMSKDFFFFQGHGKKCTLAQIWHHSCNLQVGKYHYVASKSDHSCAKTHGRSTMVVRQTFLAPTVSVDFLRNSTCTAWVIHEFLLRIDCCFTLAVRLSSRKTFVKFCSSVLSKQWLLRTKQCIRSGVRRADVSTTFKRDVSCLKIYDTFGSRRYVVLKK
jgi:hypothetical protein